MVTPFDFSFRPVQTLPVQTRPPLLSRRDRRAQRRRGATEAGVIRAQARRIAEDIEPQDQRTTLPEDLEPDIPPGLREAVAAENVDAPTGWERALGVLQTFGETTGGTLLNAIESLTPGEQSKFGENLKQVQKERGRTNPAELVANMFADTAEAFRRTDLPSRRVSLPFEIDLPGDRTLQDIDIGAKGGLELAGDVVAGAATGGLGVGGTLARSTARGAAGTAARTTGRVLTFAEDPIGGTVRGVRGTARALRATPTSEKAVPKGIPKPTTIVPDVTSSGRILEEVDQLPNRLSRMSDAVATSDRSWVGPLSWAWRRVNPTAWVRNGDDIERAFYVYGWQQDEAHSLLTEAMAPLRAQEVPFQIDELGRIVDDIGGIDPKTGKSMELKDKLWFRVFENAKDPDFDFRFTPEQAAYIWRAQTIVREAADLMRQHGIEIDDTILEGAGKTADDIAAGRAPEYFPRLLREVNNIQVERTSGRRPPQSQTRSLFGDRVVQAVEEGGVRYETDIARAVADFVDTSYHAIRLRTLDDNLKRAAKSTISSQTERLRVAADHAKKTHKQGRNALRALNSAIRGENLPGATRAAFRRNFPALSSEFDEALSVTDAPRGAALREATRLASDAVSDAKTLRKALRDIKAGRVKATEFVDLRLIVPQGVLPRSIRNSMPEVAKQFDELARPRTTVSNLIEGGVRITPDDNRINALLDSLNKSIREVSRQTDRVRQITQTERREPRMALPGSTRRFLENLDGLPRGREILRLIDEARAVDSKKERTELLKQVRDKMTPLVERLRERERQATRSLSERRERLESGLAAHIFDEKGNKIAVRAPSLRRGPQLKGFLFEPEDIERIEKNLRTHEADVYEQLYGKVGAGIVGTSDTLRILKAGFDFGAPMIQGLPLLARDPSAWARATIHHFKAFRNARLHQEFLTRNFEVVAEMRRSGVQLSGAASDFFAAVQRGGVLPALARREGVQGQAGQAILKGFQPFERSFASFGDYIRVESWKSLRDVAAREENGFRQLADFLNNATGAFSHSRVGISKSQQAIERSFMFFSPRYTRASIALVADAFQGGLRGRLARDTFLRMAAVGVGAYYAFAQMLGQEAYLDPTDGRFLTLDIAGHRVGPGSFWRSFVRFAGKTVDTAVTEPGAFLDPSNTRDNPITNWVRARSAPITGSVWDIVSGADFLGEPIEGPAEIAGHIGRQSLPFAIESLLLSDSMVDRSISTRIMGGALETTGATVYPVSAYEVRNHLRDQYAERVFEKPWEELNRLQRERLENTFADLSRITEIQEEQVARRGEEIDRRIALWDEERKEVEQQWLATVGQGMEFLQSGEIDLRTFKEVWLETATAERRTLIKDIGRRFQDVSDYFSQVAEEFGPERPEDVAYVEYLNDIVLNPGLETARGFDFEARDRLESSFVQKWGPQVLEYVQARFEEGRDVPPIVQELYSGRERFEWYWAETEKQVINSERDPQLAKHLWDTWLRSTDLQRDALEEQHPRIKRMRRKMDAVRIRLREINPELDAFLFRWGFTDILRAPANQFEGAQSFWRNPIPMSYPLPVQQFTET